MKKRIWSILLVLCMALALFPFGAQAAGGELGDGLRWSANDTLFRVYGEGAMPDFEKDGQPWSNLTLKDYTVTIDEGVTSVGKNAFYGKQIHTLYVHSTVASIGDSAFEATLLTRIMIPGSVKTIGARAFAECSALEEAELSKGLKVISDSAFRNDSALKKIRIPASVTQIGENAFAGCVLLREVNYNGTVAQWNALAIADRSGGNAPLTRAIVQCKDGIASAEPTPSDPPADQTEAFDYSVYSDVVEQVLAERKGGAYGSFVDLDLDGTPELIVARYEEGLDELVVRSVGSDLNWSAFFDSSKEYAIAYIVEYPDGTRGILMEHKSDYDTPGGQDERGRQYYWVNSGFTLYRVEDGKLIKFSKVNSYQQETKPNENGEYYYSKTDRTISIDNRRCTEKQYDAWYKTYVDPAEVLMMLSPWQDVGGMTGPELLAFTQTGFCDVPAGQYYAEPVKWAAENGITNGTSPLTFSPNEFCTRGQVVTFLWRAAGEPAPKSAKNPFKDVNKDAYYYTAVLWAVEKGITNGTSATTFSPGDPCTRGQVVTFLHRNAGSPDVKAKNPFKDVKSGAYYYDPVLWAVKNEITNGTSATAFSPNNTCTRGQIVTFLYRGLAGK